MSADIINFPGYRKPAPPPEIGCLAKMLTAAAAIAPETWNLEFAQEVDDLISTVMQIVGRAMYGGSKVPRPILEP